MPTPAAYQTRLDTLGEWAKFQAVLDSYMAGVATATIARVTAVNAGGVGPVGTVSVQFLVNQQDGEGNNTEHGTASGLPYMRYQGGSSALIIDPVVGDIGTVVFAHRDISRVVNTRGQAGPGSFRMHDMSDGIYMPGILNGTPTQYLQFTENSAILKASSQFTVNVPQTTINGNLIVTNGVTGTFIDQSGATMTFIAGILVNGTNTA